MNAGNSDKPIVLAYSGGLDTSFLVPWLKDNYGRPIITVTVDTGGIDAAGAKTLAERSKAYGAIAHHQIDARADYFEQVLRFLVMGNVRRGQLYPLCVGAERVMQAQTDRAHGAQARHEFHRARLHGRGQRPGALRSGDAHARAGARGDRAGARQGVQAPGRAGLSEGAQPAASAVWRGLLHQSRPVGRDHRWQGNADLGRQHSGFGAGCCRRTRSRIRARRRNTPSNSRRAARSASTAR